MAEKTMSEHDQAIMRVMKSLARLRAHGNPLPARNERGAAPVIVTLPADRVGDVEKRVSHVGGLANVALAFSDGFMMWSWDQNAVATPATVDVHEDSTMDMLRLWLDECEGEASINLVHAALSRPREIEYQF